MHFTKAIMSLFALSSFAAAYHHDSDEASLAAREEADLAARDEAYVDYLYARQEYMQARDVYRRAAAKAPAKAAAKAPAKPAGKGAKAPPPGPPPPGPGLCGLGHDGKFTLCIRNMRNCGTCGPRAQFNDPCLCSY